MIRIGVCLAIITAACLLPIASQAMPKALEIDKSNKDLDELEALLTGQHPGASFVGEGELYLSSRPGPNLAPVKDLPYWEAFWNDTIFGSFVREWEMGFMSQGNQTYDNGISSSPIWSSISAEGETGIVSHRRKPLLVSEPDF